MPTEATFFNENVKLQYRWQRKALYFYIIANVFFGPAIIIVDVRIAYLHILLN